MALREPPFFVYEALIILVGLSTGALSMGIYQRLSPQEAMDDLRRRIREIQAELKAYEGDFGGMRVLLRESLRLSFQRVTCALVPSLCAGVPVFVVSYGLDVSQAAQYRSITVGPDWVGSWMTLFFAAAAASALTVKCVFRTGRGNHDSSTDGNVLGVERPCVSDPRRTD